VAANFLNSLSVTVRTPFLLTIPAMQTFMLALHSTGPKIPLTVRCVCYGAVSNLLVLPFPNLRDPEQGWDSRSAQYNEFVGLLLAPFYSLRQVPNFVEGKVFQQESTRNCIIETLKISKALADTVKSEGKMPKSVVYDALKGTLPAVSSLFSLYVNDSAMADVFLEFFLSLFESLRGQVGPAFTRDTITMFLSLMGGEQLAIMLTRDQASGAEFISKYPLPLPPLRGPLAGFSPFVIVVDSFLSSRLSWRNPANPWSPLCLVWCLSLSPSSSPLLGVAVYAA